MYIATFYSYRGGVGCTTALVNAGYELARRGRKVLLVDFDLESPGLTGLLSRPAPVLTDPGNEEDLGEVIEIPSTPGIIEYVTNYIEEDEPSDVKDYIYPVIWNNLKGQLRVMPAGSVDDTYWQALADLDWQALYDRQDGYLFFEHLRHQWEQFAFDYVLIDTHSGITPALGISTRQLADGVVILLKPHQKSLDGLHEVSWTIYQEAEQTGRKPVKQFFVHSWVLEADENRMHAFEDLAFETAAGIFPFVARIPFSHRLLLGEPDFGIHLAGRFEQAHRRLANGLIAANFTEDRDGALLLLRKIHTNPDTLIERYDRV